MNRTDYALCYYDDRGQRADAQARAAQRYASQMTQALWRNDPGALVDMGTRHTGTVTEAIADMLYDDRIAAGLVNAIHLCLTGKYEASSKAMLKLADAMSLAHGLEVAELRAPE